MISKDKLELLLENAGIPRYKKDIQTSEMFEWEVFYPMKREGTQHFLDGEEFFITAFELNRDGKLERDIPPQKAYGAIIKNGNRFAFAKVGKSNQRLKSTISMNNPRGYGLIICKSMYQAERVYNQLLIEAEVIIKEVVNKFEKRRVEINERIIDTNF